MRVKSSAIGQKKPKSGAKRSILITEGSRRNKSGKAPEPADSEKNVKLVTIIRPSFKAKSPENYNMDFLVNFKRPSTTLVTAQL